MKGHFFLNISCWGFYFRSGHFLFQHVTCFSRWYLASVPDWLQRRWCVCAVSVYGVCLRRRAGGGGRGAFGSRCVTLLPSVCADGAVSSVTAGSQKSRENNKKAATGSCGSNTRLPQTNQSRGRDRENKKSKEKEQQPEIDTDHTALDKRPRGVCSAKLNTQDCFHLLRQAAAHMARKLKIKTMRIH